MRVRRSPLFFALSLFGASCSVRTPPVDVGVRQDTGTPDVRVPVDVPSLDTPRDTSFDAPTIIDPDAACASATSPAVVERLPVDIIWVVDNSTSMAPAIEEVRRGMNAFADQLFASGLDYRLILLSLRTTTTGRYAICVDPPLAGPGCADGERFFQIDVDIRSTQPIEQILGTLAQTAGYTMDEANGGPPWRGLLRDGATKTIVVVTDDNSRTCARPNPGGSCSPTDPPLTETSLEDFPGGGNPFSSRVLGPGLLTAAYGALFEGYTFNGVYGWGSETDVNATCTYPDGSSPPNAGQTYTALVERTGGVRARICDGAAAWGPFFDAVASTVLRTSRIACELAVPPPPAGMILLPSQVNVLVDGVSGEVLLPRVLAAGACDPSRGGWYYDDNTAPTRIFLCPASCELAQAEVTEPGTGLNVLFGCESVVF
jgi:hypothetical protein